MVIRRLASTALVVTVTLAGCNTLKPLEDCSSDAECGRGTRCNTSGNFCETGRPVRIGVVLSLTGNLRFRAIGEAARLGLELAVDILNEEEPRVLDRGIELVFTDDESDVASAGAKTEMLVRQHVAAVIGPLTSGQTQEARKPTEAARLLHLAPLAGSEELRMPLPLSERFLFQLSPTIAAGSPNALVKFLLEEQVKSPAFPRCLRTFVISNDDPAGRDYDTVYRERFRTNGMCVRGGSAVPTARKADYVAEVDSLFAANPDCVVLSVHPDVGGSIFEEVERRGRPLTWMWLGNTLTHGPQFLDATRVAEGGTTRSRAEGFVGSDVDYTPNRNAYRELLAAANRLRGARGQPLLIDLPPFSLQYADALFLVALALEKAGGADDPLALREAFLAVAQADPGDESFSPGQIHDAIRAIRRGRPIDYSGGSSDVQFIEGGFMASSPTAIFRIEGGKFVENVRKYNDNDVRDVQNATGDGCR